MLTNEMAAAISSAKQRVQHPHGSRSALKATLFDTKQIMKLADFTTRSAVE